MIPTDKTFYPPDEQAIAILRKLLNTEFAGARELLTQLPGLQVRQVDSDGSLELLVGHGDKARVKSCVPVEASYSDIGSTDPHGPRVRILLHVLGGGLHELEFYKDDGSAIARLPTEDELLIDVNECD
jgi:hypothetical protein